METKDTGWKPRILDRKQEYWIETKFIEWKPRISDGNQCYWMNQGNGMETRNIE